MNHKSPRKCNDFHFIILSVQMQKMFLLMKVIATAVLLTTVYLMKKGAYYLFIIIRSWKLVQSFTRDPSILTCSFKICSKNRMTYWVTLFRTDGSHFKLHIKWREDGCHSSLSLLPLFLSFFLHSPCTSDEWKLSFLPSVVLKPPKQGFPM